MKIADFFAMGGYGFYVWSAYGVTLLALLIPTLKIVYLTRKRKAKKHESTL